jgi:hypothetical protein
MNDEQGSEDGKGGADLKLVEGGLHRLERIHGIDLVRGPDHLPPFVVEAVVLEEDTCLVLSTPADVVVTPEHPIRVMTEVNTASPLAPGSIVVREGAPARFLAIVHDLDREPSWEEEWVERALDGALREAAARGLRSLGLQMIGSVHGGLPSDRFLCLLREALRRVAPECLARIWLISPP